MDPTSPLFTVRVRSDPPVIEAVSDEIVAGTPSNIPRPTSVSDHFGRDFNLSDDGNTLVVGVHKWNSIQGKAIVYEKDSVTYEWVYKCELMRNGGVPGDELGEFPCVSGDGSTIALGGNGNGLNSVFIYERPGASWGTTNLTETVRFTPNGNHSIWRPASNSFTFDGSVLVCGDPFYNNPSYREGTIYLVVRNGASWVNNGATFSETRKLFPSNPVNNGRFGGTTRISSDGTFVSAGCMFAGFEGTNSGTGYVFNRPVGGWDDSTANLYHSAQLSTSQISTDAWLGHNLEISEDGSTILLIAISEDTTYNNSGRGYLYKRPESGIWVNSDETTILENSDQATEDWLGDQYGGASLSLDGSVVAFGTWRKTIPKVYVWQEPKDGGWVSGIQTESISVEGPGSGSFFSWNVELNREGDKLIIGAPYEGTTTGGDLFLYDINWSPEITDVNIPKVSLTGSFNNIPDGVTHCNIWCQQLMQTDLTARSNLVRLLLNNTTKEGYLHGASDANLTASTVLCATIDGNTQAVYSTVKVDDLKNAEWILTRDAIDGTLLGGSWEAIINFQVISPYLHDKFKIVVSS